MKKYFVLVMLSALTVSSCSKNDRLEEPTEWSTPLGFSTYIGTSTKASDLVNTSFVKFTVEAYSYAKTMAEAATENSGLTEDNKTKVTTYIPALTVERTYTPEDTEAGTSATFSDWTYTGAYYWPASNYLNFFAYATEGLSGEQGVTYGTPTYEGDKPTLSYTATETIANQVDLVAASAVDEKDTSSGNINLAFKHILTKINFSVTGEATSSSSDKYIYEVTAITIKNVESVGTYTYAGSDTANETDGATSTATGVGSWAMTVDGTNNQVDYAHFAPADAADHVKAEDQTKTTVTGTNGSLMLIPQAHATGTTAVIEVAYKVWQGATEVVDYTTNTKEITLEGITWAPGQNILYNLTLPIGASKITFTTSALEDWETAVTTDTTTTTTTTTPTTPAPAAM